MILLAILTVNLGTGSGLCRTALWNCFCGEEILTRDPLQRRINQ